MDDSSLESQLEFPLSDKDRIANTFIILPHSTRTWEEGKRDSHLAEQAY